MFFTSPKNVRRRIEKTERNIDKREEWIEELRNEISNAHPLAAASYIRKIKDQRTTIEALEIYLRKLRKKERRWIREGQLAFS